MEWNTAFMRERAAPAPIMEAQHMRGRAFRRHEKAKSRARAVRRAKSKTWVGRACVTGWVKFCETPQRCSCRGCGNQRKFEGAPVSERRQWQEKTPEA